MIKSSSKQLKQFIAGISIPLVVLICCNVMPICHRAGLAWQDLLFIFRGSLTPPSSIVIVAIDEPSLHEIDLQWPWPRHVNAAVVNRLKKAGAKVIAFDVLFSEKAADPLEDTSFKDAIASAGNVILAENIGHITRKGYEEVILERPLDMFSSNAAGTGLTNLFPDKDGIVRKGSVKILDRPTLAAAIFRAAGGDPAPPERQTFLVDFPGPSGTFKTVSCYQVLEKDMLPDNIFKDKIILIGAAMDASPVIQGAPDTVPTPFFRFSGIMTPGVEVQAACVWTMLSGFPLERLPALPFFPFYLLAGAIPFFLHKGRPLSLVSSVAIISLTLCILSFSAFMTAGTVIDITPGLFAIFTSGLFWGVAGHLSVGREKRIIKRAFCHYVSKDVLRGIEKNHDRLNLGGELCHVSIIFADLRNFTGLSEELSPQSLIFLLNKYLETMSASVLHNRGMIDKYIGDSLMAVFGAPLPVDGHASLACKSALEMTRAVKALGHKMRISSETENYFGASTAVGLNSGTVVAGNIGSAKRFDYTVIGDHVNLAARLEGLCRHYRVDIIASEHTQKEAGTDFFFRLLDRVRVAGSTRDVDIYELLDLDQVDERLIQDIIARYQEGMEYYWQRQWKQAATLFSGLLADYPADGPSRVMLGRCKKFLEFGPPGNWQGTYKFKSK